MTGNGERKISSLRDLPRDIAPPRDLWQGIEARIVTERNARLESSSRRSGRATRVSTRLSIIAVAATIATLAIGIWIGRALLPLPGKSQAAGAGLTVTNTTTGEPMSFHAAYLLESKYTRERAELVKDLEARLAALPPESRAKVVASLETINESKRNLEAELGKDPSNALLQELLVNTYQDEMRVLTAVHEAGRPGEGI
jgi:hypothetical protein